MEPFFSVLLVETWWAGPLLWALAYVSDYRLTIACAARYKAQDKFVFEGSYELNPVFVADINALRAFSPRFVLLLVGTTLYLVLVQRVSAQNPGFQGLYLFVLGAMLGMQMTIHMRHLKNWFLFAGGLQHVRGRAEYPRGFILRVSAQELGLFAALYGILFAITGSTFVLGACLASVVLAINHVLLARRHEKTSGVAAVREA